MNQTGERPKNPLRLIVDLTKKLHAENVSYCHWKSNVDLGKSLSGMGDLDLLVDRRQVSTFTAILHRLGFKRAVTSFARRFPGIEHYYGFDKESGLLIHLHVHYQLILGERYVKSFHLPLEQAILNSAKYVRPIYVADPACELILFVIRMILKFNFLELFRYNHIQSSNSSLERELRFLQMSTKMEEVHRIIRNYLPTLPKDLFDKCLEALLHDLSAVKLMRLRHQLVSALSAHRRNGVLGVISKIAVRKLFVTLNNRLQPHPSRKRLSTGGLAIAIVGSDGAGKSTLVHETERWLSRVFDVRTIHMGKPSRSLISISVYFAIKAIKSLIVVLNKPKLQYVVSLDKWPKYLLWVIALQYVCVARDRNRAYRFMRRLVGQGKIVICDRYPLKDLKLMDCRRVNQLYESCHKSVLKRFIQLEEQLYEEIERPNLLIALRVTPEIGASRQRNEDFNSVIKRGEAFWQFTKNAHKYMRIIDADLPQEKVLAIAKDIIWESL